MSTAGYDGTPSFYRDQSTFERYLGQTSYYLGLQRAVTHLIRMCKPTSVVDLGAGTGATTLALAKALPSACVTGVDMRSSMVEAAKQLKSTEGLANVTIKRGDMVEYVQELEEAQFLVMLYSFHHIEDPLAKKVEFLRACYRSLRLGGRLCVAETFLPVVKERTTRRAATDELWSRRPLEGSASTFWSALEDLTPAGVKQAQEVGRFSFEHEATAGELVMDRDNEYLVERGWLEDVGRQVGFTVELSEPINTLGDGVVLLRR